MALHDFEGRLTVGRLSLGFVSEQTAFRMLREVNDSLGIRLSLEAFPHRWITPQSLVNLSNEYDIRVAGVHGPIAAQYREFLDNIRSHVGKDSKEALYNLIWMIAFGAQSDPRWLRRYGTPMELAEGIGAYLVMHEEPLRYMGSTLVRAWAKRLDGNILRENGWGPQDGRPDPLSWDIRAIRQYADEHGIQTLLDTATAARTGSQHGYDILSAYRILRPTAIHFSDYADTSQQENIVPGKGNHQAELRELIQEVKAEKTRIVLEVSPYPSAKTAICDTLRFIDRC
jgi:hypothetical protein